uniref:Putative secreted protein n=1 Tax=Anopheles triannulatus TaxID=58253 RepID=A0A2M4B746_9DIPT
MGGVMAFSGSLVAWWGVSKPWQLPSGTRLTFCRLNSWPSVSRTFARMVLSWCSRILRRPSISSSGHR